MVIFSASSYSQQTTVNFIQGDVYACISIKIAPLADIHPNFRQHVVIALSYTVTSMNHLFPQLVLSLDNPSCNLHVSGTGEESVTLKDFG